MNSNLQNYEQVIDQAKQEIPKEIRSLNTSNFNSSSRYHKENSDKLSKHITNRTDYVAADIANNGETLSDQTLKTILDLQSDRAQTNHQVKRRTTEVSELKIAYNHPTEESKVPSKTSRN